MSLGPGWDGSGGNVDESWEVDRGHPLFSWEGLSKGCGGSCFWQWREGCGDKLGGF